MASLLEDDAEGWARLQGLFAQLSLPPIRMDDGNYRRRVVEVEVAPGKWVPIAGASIDHVRLIVWTGNNGSTVQYAFPRGERVPDWRVEKQPRRHTIAEGG